MPKDRAGACCTEIVGVMNRQAAMDTRLDEGDNRFQRLESADIRIEAKIDRLPFIIIGGQAAIITALWALLTQVLR